MQKQQIPWYVSERSEALAKVLLSSRDDVRVRSQSETEFGLNLLLEITAGSQLSSRLFVVQVKGTTSTDEEVWLEDVKELFSIDEKVTYLPTCVFVLNVRDNQSFYAWMAEPHVEANGVSLRFVRPDQFLDLDHAAVDLIVEQVKAWYAGLPRQLLAN